MSLAWQMFWLLVGGTAIFGVYKVDVPLGWRLLLALAALALYMFALNQFLARQQRAGWVAYNMHPKDVLRYLCHNAKWATRFSDRSAWFAATQMAIRDELRQGRRLQAQGRPSGKWGDGGFRHPADVVERDFWAGGDLNWIRVLNSDYHGDIDAEDRGYGGRDQKSFDDVLFSEPHHLARAQRIIAVAKTFAVRSVRTAKLWATALARNISRN